MLQHEKRRCLAAFGILGAGLLLLLLLNLRIGSVRVPMDQLWEILRGENRDSTAGQIIWTIRMPRLIAAAVLGGALAVAGFLLQTFFSNPIAGPFVLGISSGAKLTVAIAMIVSLRMGASLSSGAMILSAFAGAGLSMGMILMISGRVNRMSVLVVCGVMIGYICSAITDFMVTFAEDSNIVNLHNWSRGSFSGTGWENVRTMVPVVLVAILLSFLLSKPMGAYQLGEKYAVSLGVNLRRLRLALILLLMQRKRVLLLDEPFCGLDAESVFVVQQLILQLGCEGRTLLIAADSLALLDGICDDLYVLGGGQVQGRYEHYEFQRAIREAGSAAGFPKK